MFLRGRHLLVLCVQGPQTSCQTEEEGQVNGDTSKQNGSCSRFSIIINISIWRSDQCPVWQYWTASKEIRFIRFFIEKTCEFFCSKRMIHRTCILAMWTMFSQNAISKKHHLEDDCQVIAGDDGEDSQPLRVYDSPTERNRDQSIQVRNQMKHKKWYWHSSHFSTWIFVSYCKSAGVKTRIKRRTLARIRSVDHPQNLGKASPRAKRFAH